MKEGSNWFPRGWMSRGSDAAIGKKLRDELNDKKVAAAVQSTIAMQKNVKNRKYAPAPKKGKPAKAPKDSKCYERGEGYLYLQYITRRVIRSGVILKDYFRTMTCCSEEDNE
ncbi:Protein of unknown function [Pyronema omphalodes CBS 100304]|uniref:Uncharacterized protein n=1 Tax=Pyronema omphalodes (strain CBS 100304) TaxID=1076935 RepID=U4L6N0_PYROM|nr:Protein of unknown function [Pyronema omphalodes CBS 100304]